jgi:hypothetical protein
MTTSRLLVYGALGIVAGLLMENAVLNVRRRSVAKALENKKKENKEIRHHKQLLHN